MRAQLYGQLQYQRQASVGSLLAGNNTSHQRRDEVDLASDAAVTALPGRQALPDFSVLPGLLISGAGLVGQHLHPLLEPLTGFFFLKPAVSNTSIEAKIHSQLRRFLLNQRTKCEVCSDFLHTDWLSIPASGDRRRSTINLLDLGLNLTGKVFSVCCLLEA